MREAAWTCGRSREWLSADDRLSSSYGGMMDIGPTNTNKYYTDKPTAVLSATWIRGSHQYKAGADWRIDA